MSRAVRRWLAALAVIALCSLGAMCAGTPPPDLPALPSGDVKVLVTYEDDVRPVLDTRCVVCHACYDAPCQLQLTSYEGIDRGATKAPVYQATRLSPAKPTRLFTDAKTTAEWRERGFHSVTERDADSNSGPLLLDLLALGRAQSFAADEKLPASFPLDISRKLSCPTPGEEFARYADKQPQGGMPYGTAPLSDPEVEVLAQWVGAGAPAPKAPKALPDTALAQVSAWEQFLNGDSLKEQITTRYLYEHWFLAHLQLDGLAEGPFFQIVRSATAPGEPVHVIPGRRPYSDPEQSFWYRLVPVTTTIVHKTHIVYPFGAAKLARVRELFIEPDWQPTRLPGYKTHDASNPFVTFDQIPPRARYEFLLDDAQYFVMTFIRGPVCRGQVAVDVIEDHFFVGFVDPDHDATVTHPDFLEWSKKLLALPGEHASHPSPGQIWHEYNKDQKRYLDARDALYDQLDPERKGRSLEMIWDGDGTNPNALLTVFRHFDNANVVRGWVGATPKTAWVMDYPLLERLYYDLVADFDVFGSLTHQLSTRTYMDHLRMQSEVAFLSFLPADSRQAIRASWYVGATGKKAYEVDDIRDLDHGTQIVYESDDPKVELIEMLMARTPAIAVATDSLNRCAAPPCDREGSSELERTTERVLQKLTGVHGAWVKELPEVALLRVRSNDSTSGDGIYTLIHNRAHTNVASPFSEDKRLEPDKDTLTVIHGFVASYPNFMFEVPEGEIESFGIQLSSVETAADLEALADRFGVRRTSAKFWSNIDWVHEEFRRRQPVRAGILDLGRYENL